ILEVSKKRVDVGGVPAAVDHLGRKSANKPEAAQGGFGVPEHGRGHAVVAIENGQRAFAVDSDEEHGGIDQVLLHGKAEGAELAEKLVVVRRFHLHADAVDYILQIEAALGDAAPLGAREETDAGKVFRS